MTDRPTDAEAWNTGRSTNSPAQPQSRDPEPDFDDGLVHDHGWACRERGAPAY